MTGLLFVSFSALAAKIFSLDAVYVLTGLILFVLAAMTYADRGIQSGARLPVLGCRHFSSSTSRETAR